jgi:Cys-rich repeat protein
MLSERELPPGRWLARARSELAGLAAALVVCGIAACNAEEDGSIDLFSDRGTDSGSADGVVCHDDRDCPDDVPHCDRDDGQCVECTEDAHCEQGECDERAHRCVECTDSRDCEGSRPACFEGVCVGCVEAADCDEPGETCDLESHTCVGGCETNDDCGWSDQGICDTTTGVCVECLTAADCEGREATRICSEGRCVQCVVDTDCYDQEPYCDSPRGDCVQCLEDDHCPSGQTCRGHRCER